jgi:hypothetical protein
MGKFVLGDLLTGWEQHELDISIYVPAGVEVNIETVVTLLPFNRDTAMAGRISTGKIILWVSSKCVTSSKGSRRS